MLWVFSWMGSNVLLFILFLAINLNVRLVLFMPWWSEMDLGAVLFSAFMTENKNWPHTIYIVLNRFWFQFMKMHFAYHSFACAFVGSSFFSSGGETLDHFLDRDCRLAELSRALMHSCHSWTGNSMRQGWGTKIWSTLSMRVNTQHHNEMMANNRAYGRSDTFELFQQVVGESNVMWLRWWFVSLYTVMNIYNNNNNIINYSLYYKESILWVFFCH